MSLQEVDGKEVYVVEFDEIPELPITHNTEEEQPYAVALALAIKKKEISEPGKYGIFVTEDRKNYEIYRIKE